MGYVSVFCCSFYWRWWMYLLDVITFCHSTWVEINHRKWPDIIWSLISTEYRTDKYHTQFNSPHTHTCSISSHNKMWNFIRCQYDLHWATLSHTLTYNCNDIANSYTCIALFDTSYDYAMGCNFQFNVVVKYSFKPIVQSASMWFETWQNSFTWRPANLKNH